MRPPTSRYRSLKWALDFMADDQYDGRGFRILDIIDEGHREALAIEIGTSIPSARVIRVMGDLYLEVVELVEFDAHGLFDPLCTPWRPAVASAPEGSWGRPASEPGRLCRADKVYRGGVPVTVEKGKGGPRMWV